MLIVDVEVARRIFIVETREFCGVSTLSGEITMAICYLLQSLTNGDDLLRVDLAVHILVGGKSLCMEEQNSDARWRSFADTAVGGASFGSLTLSDWAGRSSDPMSSAMVKIASRLSKMHFFNITFFDSWIAASLATVSFPVSWAH